MSIAAEVGKKLTWEDIRDLGEQKTELVPDLSFLAKDRLHLIRGPYVDVAPDLALEILSPSNRKRDTELKFQYYARFGVREYWIVDPETKTIAVFVERAARHQLLGEFSAGQNVETHVLAGLQLDPVRVF